MVACLAALAANVPQYRDLRIVTVIAALTAVAAALRDPLPQGALVAVACALFLLFSARESNQKLAPVEATLALLLFLVAILHVARLSGVPLTMVLATGVYLQLAAVVLLLRAHNRFRNMGGARALTLMLWLLAICLDIGTQLIGLQWPALRMAGLAIALFAFPIEFARAATQTSQRKHLLHGELQTRAHQRSEELLASREALLASERRTDVGLLAANVGHEINNPLAYVGGNLQFIHESLLERPVAVIRDRNEGMQLIEDALEGVRRIQGIVQDLVVYSRGASSLQTEANLRQSIDIAMRIVAPQTRYSMPIDVDVAGDIIVRIGESQLVQVIVHLLLNAAQASAQQDQALATCLRSESLEEHVVLEIQDKGCGMNTAELCHAQRPLITRDASHGSGLGLFVCHSIVNGTGGAIDIASQAGKGTTVRVSLRKAKAS